MLTLKMNETQSVSIFDKQCMILKMCLLRTDYEFPSGM
jgi:hypothetical protein